MRPLLIDNEAKAKIECVMKYAEMNPFSMDEMLDIYNKELSPAGDMDGFAVNLYRGFKVVYSIEKQPSGKFKHISISVDKEGKLPSIESAQLIISEFGFTGNISGGTCDKVAMETFAPNHQAINIWEKHK